MELGEGFLEKDGPELFFWSHFDVRVLVAAAIGLWDEVVDEDGDGHSKGVHLDGVDTGAVELFLVKHVPNALWVLSQGGDCREDPAVTERALPDIVEGDTILRVVLEKCVATRLREDLGSAAPVDCATFCHGFSFEEGSVGVLGALGIESRDIWLFSVQSCERGLALATLLSKVVEVLANRLRLIEVLSVLVEPHTLADSKHCSRDKALSN